MLSFHPQAARVPANWSRHGRLWAALALSLLALSLMGPVPARAAPVLLAYAGSGNAVLFDATTGQGGWVGAIDEVPDPSIPDPAALVSVVLFQFDAATGLLEGRFEFTDSLDLDSALVGTLSGRSTAAELFGSGGPLEIDYLVTGGSGRFAGYRGFGLAFLNLDPAASGDNYAESGLLVLSVPAPGSLGLAAAALALLALQGRRRAR